MTDMELITIKTEPVEIEIEFTRIKEECTDDDESAVVKNELELPDIKETLKKEVTPIDNVRADTSNQKKKINNTVKKKKILITDKKLKDYVLNKDNKLNAQHTKEILKKKVVSNKKDLLNNTVTTKKRVLKTNKKKILKNKIVPKEYDVLSNDNAQDKPLFVDRRGIPMMMLNKYTFSVENKSKINLDTTEILWFCFNGRPSHCQAKAHTRNGHVVKVTGAHNHYHKRKYKKRGEGKPNEINTLNTLVDSSGKQDTPSEPENTSDQTIEHTVSEETVYIKIEPDIFDADEQNTETNINIKTELNIENNPLSWDTMEQAESPEMPLPNTSNVTPQERPRFQQKTGTKLLLFQEQLFSVQTDNLQDMTEVTWVCYTGRHTDCQAKICTTLNVNYLNVENIIGTHNHECTTLPEPDPATRRLARDTDSGIQKRDIKGYRCKICHKTFINLKNHMLQMHSKKSQNKPKFYCEDCTGSFNQWRNLIRHRCLEIFPCNVCNRKLINRHSLDIHISTHENEDRGEFGCQVCGATFVMERYLKTHITRVHKNPIRCR